MASILRFLAALAVAGLIASSSAKAECVPDPTQDGDPIQYFLDIEPSDGVLDVWCRFQKLKGDYKVDVWFEGIPAHRSFDTKFDGTPGQGKEVMASFIQSLLPSGKGAQSKDEKGQEFPKVLADVVQATAPRTPDGQQIGLPPEYPMADAVALWEPVTLRLKPLNAFGADFVLLVTFKPSVAKFIQGMQGLSEPFIIKGATERVMSGVVAGATGTECPQFIPVCGKLAGTETMDIRTTWVVDSVVMQSEQGRMSPTTSAFFNGLVAKYGTLVTDNTMDRFSYTDGTAHVTVADPTREILAMAKGDPDKSLGTQKIRVVWHEKNVPTSYRNRLAEWTTQVREKLVMKYSGADYRRH